MVRVEIPSEVLNVVNFVLLDIILLPYALFMSSKLAGFSNNEALNKRGTIHLVEYKIPAIGGSLVMSAGWRRRCLIGLRLAILMFVAVANLGIEGRTVQNAVIREAVIRVPGPSDLKHKDSVSAAINQIECSEAEGDLFVFGSVIDNECFIKIKDYVTIHEVSEPFVERTAPMQLCTITSKDCQRTIYRCENVELSCNGVSKDTECHDPQGIVPNSCAGIVYDDENEGAYVCDSGDIVGDSLVKMPKCRHFVAKREDIVHWVETYELMKDGSDTGMLSVFATAYGAKRMQNVTVSEESRVVTDVNMLWIIPASMTVGVCLALTAYVVFQQCWEGSKAVLQDEHGLLKHLGKPVQLVQMANGDNDEPGEGVGHTIFCE